MKIAGLVKSSTIDFPGRLAAVLFTPGCNFDCFYCHNRQLLSESASLYDPAELLDFLQKRRQLLEGVVISGGEPLLQTGLADFLARIKQMGYQIKLDTNGSWPARLQELLQNSLIDYLALDYKAPWSAYGKIIRCQPDTGKKVRLSLALLDKEKISWEVRTTIAPHLAAVDLVSMASQAPALPAWYWQAYTQPQHYEAEDKELLQAAPLKRAELEKLTESLSLLQPAIHLRY